MRIKCLQSRTIGVVFTYVKDLCSALNGQYVNLASEKYRRLHKPKLAGSLKNNRMKVDVLIGAYFYWSFVENTIFRGYHYDSIALKSKLGFLLCGPIFIKNVSRWATFSFLYKIGIKMIINIKLG